MNNPPIPEATATTSYAVVCAGTVRPETGLIFHSRSIGDIPFCCEHCAQRLPDIIATAAELDRLQAAHAAEDREWQAARDSGLDFIPGCQCCGGNTPELIGRCPCRSIDLRPDPSTT